MFLLSLRSLKCSLPLIPYFCNTPVLFVAPSCRSGALLIICSLNCLFDAATARASCHSMLHLNNFLLTFLCNRRPFSFLSFFCVPLFILPCSVHIPGTTMSVSFSSFTHFDNILLLFWHQVASFFSLGPPGE